MHSAGTPISTSTRFITLASLAGSLLPCAPHTMTAPARPALYASTALSSRYCSASDGSPLSHTRAPNTIRQSALSRGRAARERAYTHATRAPPTAAPRNTKISKTDSMRRHTFFFINYSAMIPRKIR